ncbi:hypothetical protein SPRG_16162 [Saprolegnia parasitica CBS 223.65]|uniref:Glycoside hydrolase family 5 domain-containing protein n=1 Tax=Saprolegnia parasitica (strain CBS 223.65) TaxID=695850 RepID=A0A067BJ94_SAPPC|nr:hypothetical protein SPRG_16162 [Saprolegnia parasitica CBS 223.65]KDO18504.1 hypothetical protein SPRG_16162 [Saprolegnia parasitica CBS 223.65]|eukprot:XP_012210781.1 hypothetical protein SPRG_16162 [Saprolegnia parasitica CBS 223.65]
MRRESSIRTPTEGNYEQPTYIDEKHDVTVHRESEMTARDTILADELPAARLTHSESARSFKGRYRVWPGALLLLAITAVAVVLMVYFADEARTSMLDLRLAVQMRQYRMRQIDTGLTSGSGTGLPPLIDTDGVVNNPQVYPPQTCKQPNYISKNNKIYAVAPNGTEIPLGIKGLNCGQAIPFGLWTNDKNGTTAFQVAEFLAANKINSIRLPVCIQSIVNNIKPNKNLINAAANRAVDASSYMALLKSIISTLAYRRISVLISLHTLTPTDSGGAWFSDAVPVDMFMQAVDMLTTNLCSDKYWNIIGLDVKNEPHLSTWGDNGPKDFLKGATDISHRMLKGCPNWLAFVEGIVNMGQPVTFNGVAMTYNDWWGSGLQGAGAKPVVLNTPHKVVYAPHYYTPAVYPQAYLYGGGTPGPGGIITNYVELSDADLRVRISRTMEVMFGFLAKTHDAAIVLGEFGGLYATDAHPKLTTKRCTDFTIEAMLQPGYSGGYVWSLNPESAYQFNPADAAGTFIEGVVQIDWRTANLPFVQGMQAMDAVADLQFFPCFP